jgi:hypothetical protein
MYVCVYVHRLYVCVLNLNNYRCKKDVYFLSIFQFVTEMNINNLFIHVSSLNVYKNTLLFM